MIIKHLTKNYSTRFLLHLFINFTTSPPEIFINPSSKASEPLEYALFSLPFIFIFQKMSSLKESDVWAFKYSSQLPTTIVLVNIGSDISNARSKWKMDFRFIFQTGSWFILGFMQCLDSVITMKRQNYLRILESLGILWFLGDIKLFQNDIYWLYSWKIKDGGVCNWFKLKIFWSEKSHICFTFSKTIDI